MPDSCEPPTILLALGAGLKRCSSKGAITGLYYYPPPEQTKVETILPPLCVPHTSLIPIPPSQAAAQSWDSQNGPYPGTSVQATQDSQSSQSSQSTQPIGGSPPSTPTRRNLETSRDLRLMIRTALLFKRPYKEICQFLGVTEYQIWLVKHHRLTPQKTKTGRRALLHTPQKRRLKEWLLASPSHGRIPWRHIPYYLPELDAKEDAIYTHSESLGIAGGPQRRRDFQTIQWSGQRGRLLQRMQSLGLERGYKYRCLQMSYGRMGVHTQPHM